MYAVVATILWNLCRKCLICSYPNLGVDYISPGGELSKHWPAILVTLHLTVPAGTTVVKVLDFVRLGGPAWIRTTDPGIVSTVL